MKQLLICAFMFSALLACNSEKPEAQQEQAAPAVQQTEAPATENLSQEMEADTTGSKVQENAKEIDQILEGI